MLTKRGKVYWLDVCIGKKRIRRSLKTTEKQLAIYEFKKQYEELLSQHKKGSILFSHFCNQYEDWAWSSKPASALREKQRLAKIQSFFDSINVRLLSDITPYQIEQLKSHLKAQKARKKGTVLSKSTINRYLQILRGMFYKAIDWEVYEGVNPFQRIKFYKENPQVTPLSKVQVDKILKVAKEISKDPHSPLQKTFYDICVMAVNTGMRKSEILNLKWKDIKENKVKIIGKGEKSRTIPLNKKVVAILNSYAKKSEYVFDIPNREQHDVMRRTIEQAQKRTGIKLNFHLLRHYFASSLLEKGVDIVTVGSILGHSKITVSLLYTHTSEERKEKAVELL